MQLKRVKPTENEQGHEPGDPPTVSQPGAQKQLLTIIIVVIAVAIIGVGAFLLLNQPQTKSPGEGKGDKKSAPVSVTPAIAQDVPIEVKAIGNVEAITSVQVKSQVTGQIQNVFFKEGQFVKKGDPLFLIDPRQFQAQVEQAQANVAKDLAQVKQAQAVVAKDMAQLAQNQANLQKDVEQRSFAEAEVGRYGNLVQQGAVSKEQYDQMNTNHRSQLAVVSADEAAIKNVKATIDVDKAAVENARALARADQAVLNNARVQLGYCHINSPVDGVTGSLMNHLGDMIKANDTNALIVINQVTPIYVSFSVPEQDFGAIRTYMKGQKLPVLAKLRGSDSTITGELTFFDNNVDTTTGTIRLKSTFANADHLLWPGQFVDVSLNLATQKNAVLIPSQAVQAGQKGPYVFRVKPDNTAEMVPIVSDRTYNGMAIVKEGVQAGDTIVIDGQLQVVPGGQVVIRKPISN